MSLECDTVAGAESSQLDVGRMARERDEVRQGVKAAR